MSYTQTKNMYCVLMPCAHNGLTLNLYRHRELLAATKTGPKPVVVV